VECVRVELLEDGGAELAEETEADGPATVENREGDEEGVTEALRDAIGGRLVDKVPTVMVES
jgi:hypothetical protein